MLAAPVLWEIADYARMSRKPVSQVLSSQADVGRVCVFRKMPGLNLLKDAGNDVRTTVLFGVPHRFHQFVLTETAAAVVTNGVITAGPVFLEDRQGAHIAEVGKHPDRGVSFLE